MISPPIFALVAFFILDFLELVFDIFVITAPVGVIIGFISTLMYFMWVVFTYGPKKAGEKLFKFRGLKRKQVFKKTLKVFGNSFIPFLTTWAVWDDYKEEKREKASAAEVDLRGEDRKSDEAATKKGSTMKDKLKTAGLIAATGGAGAAATAGRAAAGEALGARGATVATERAAAKQVATAYAPTNPWIVNKSSKDIIKKNVEQKTVAREIPTSSETLKQQLVSPDSYQEGQNLFNEQATYERLLKEKEVEKKEKEKKRRAEFLAKKIQGLKAEQNLREKIFEESERRFGKEAKQTERLKEESQKDKSEEDKYREEI